MIGHLIIARETKLKLDSFWLFSDIDRIIITGGGFGSYSMVLTEEIDKSLIDDEVEDVTH